LQDTVPRIHAVFAVSDAMKPTHHGTEPIEGPYRADPGVRLERCRAAVLADRRRYEQKLAGA
jgi:hypothetical protein